MSNWRPRDVVRVDQVLKNRIEKWNEKILNLIAKLYGYKIKLIKKNPENQSQALFFLNFEFLLFSGNSAFIEIF